MQRIYRIFLATALTALASVVEAPATARDNEKPRWFGSNFDDGTTVLAYGIPDSDYVMLHFSCTVGKPVVSVNMQDEESTADEGAPMHVRLSGGGERIEFSEKAIPNEDSGGKDVKASLPLDDTLRRILTATGALEIVVDGHTKRYRMNGAAEPVAAMLAACDAPRPPGDLDVTVTNKAKRPLQSFGYSEAGVHSFDSDAFGYEALASGASRSFTIPGGRTICTFDLSVTFAEKGDEECCSDGKPAGTQNFCENAEFIVHD